MRGRTHYEVLGVPAEASADAIRDAYRDLAREHHPDRQVLSSGAGADVDMSAVNEAYRVLKDEARRAMYDSSLREGPAVGPGDSAWAGTASNAAEDSGRQHPIAHPRARISWRWVLVMASVVVVGGLVLTQFTDPADTPEPDGVLRIGDCVEIEADLDVHEVSCTGDPNVDQVVQAVVEFDARCPARTEPHRDQLGLGIACVAIPG